MVILIIMVNIFQRSHEVDADRQHTLPAAVIRAVKLKYVVTKSFDSYISNIT